MVREYDRRRHFIVRGFNRIGLECCNLKEHFTHSLTSGIPVFLLPSLVERLLDEKKVVTIPGDVFGEAGEGFLRCAYAASIDDIEKPWKEWKTLLIG